MHARRWLTLVLIFSVLGVLSASFAASAQEIPTCPALVNTALNQLGTNCANLERNQSCYGYPDIQHTAFEPGVPVDFYSQPGDRSELTITEAIQTGPLNTPTSEWGVNVMNVEANIPNALPGKGVVYIQTGGVEVENGVEPGEAVGLVDGISVSTVSQTDLLTWPAPSITGHASDTILNIPSGAALSVDAVSPSGDFVRVVYQNRVGWVSTSALASGADFSGLPTIGPDDMTPMEDFYFRVGVGGVPCVDAPSLLFVQTPTNVPADLRVFDTPFRINGSVIYRSLPPGDQLGNRIEIIVLAGIAIIDPDTDAQIIIPPGFRSSVSLCPEFVSLGIEGDADEKAVCGSWSQPTPLTQAELDELSVVTKFPSNIVNTPVSIPVIVQASGEGVAASTLTFPNQAALDQARAACLSGQLTGDICTYLGLPTT